jgi:precorrin-2/cobalt-factor-2 C20-methyltransferase
MKKGTLFGIGVGPGDPELLTVKAVKAIEKADLIITPKTEKKEDSVAYSIASSYIPKDCEVLRLTFPMLNDKKAVAAQWAENLEIIKKHLDQGQNIVFLTLGDPMLFSTYMYMFNGLKDTEYPVATIPGIPAFLGIASYIGRMITEWEENVLIISATADAKHFDKALAAADNAVIMKVYKKFDFVRQELIKHHMIHNAVLVSRAGLDHEVIERDLLSLPKDYKPNYLSTILTKRDK